MLNNNSYFKSNTNKLDNSKSTDMVIYYHVKSLNTSLAEFDLN